MVILFGNSRTLHRIHRRGIFAVLLKLTLPHSSPAVFSHLPRKPVSSPFSSYITPTTYTLACSTRMTLRRTFFRCTPTEERDDGLETLRSWILYRQDCHFLDDGPVRLPVIRRDWRGKLDEDSFDLENGRSCKYNIPPTYFVGHPVNRAPCVIHMWANRPSKQFGWCWIRRAMMTPWSSSHQSYMLELTANLISPGVTH